MKKLVGLSRTVKQEWLIKTVELLLQTADENEIKERLNEYLSFEIKSPTVLRMTREILLNIWGRPSNNMEAHIQREAIKVFQSGKCNQIALEWSMILLAYPIFSDVAGLIGKISLVQDTFSTSWLKEKLYSIWGERTTLVHFADKILQTLKHLGAIENVKVGTYKICRQQVTDDDTIRIMLMALLALNKKAYYEVSELSRIPLFFPFEYNATLELLHNRPEFTISNFGGKMVVSAEQV